MGFFGRSVLTPLPISLIYVLFEFLKKKSSMQKLKFNGNSEGLDLQIVSKGTWNYS